MATIIPFRGVLYNQEKVDINDVVAPPYDVIAPDLQERLYERSPNNVVRLILGKEADRYASAAGLFHAWQADRTLIRDDTPALYVLHQTFEESPGHTITRKGFIALCRLEEFDKQIVLPHEKTLAKPREDRFKLFQATNANFSQVFTLYGDPEKRVDGFVNGIAHTPAAVDVIFEEVRNRMWKLQDAAAVGRVQEFLADKQVLIADGHHRYETALAYRDLMRSRNPRHTGKELYNYVMMFFTNIDDEGLVIYPTHRIVHSLKVFSGREFLERAGEYFIVRAVRDAEAVKVGLQASTTRAFGVVLNDDPTFYLLTLKPALSAAGLIREDIPDAVKELDVTVLHTVLLKGLLGISQEAQEQKWNLEYSKVFEEAVDAVRTGKGQVAFLMNATRIDVVRKVAKSGLTMPQKSTYFYPKLLSGLVMNTMAEV